MRRLVAWGALVLALIWAGAAPAALAPNYERLRELAEILGSDAVMTKLDHEIVEGIEAVDGGSYRVWTARCSVVVDLVSTPNAPPIAGPWRFTIQAREPRCGNGSR